MTIGSLSSAICAVHKPSSVLEYRVFTFSSVRTTMIIFVLPLPPLTQTYPLLLRLRDLKATQAGISVPVQNVAFYG